MSKKIKLCFDDNYEIDTSKYVMIETMKEKVAEAIFLKVYIELRSLYSDMIKEINVMSKDKKNNELEEFYLFSQDYYDTPIFLKYQAEASKLYIKLANKFGKDVVHVNTYGFICDACILSLNNIVENIDIILEENPGVHLSDAIRVSVINLCNDFNEDLNHEVSFMFKQKESHLKLIENKCEKSSL